MAVDASIGNSLADILQKLAYFKAGGGRPSIGQQVGEVLTAAGSVPGKYAEGLSLADQRAKQIMETAKLRREITPTVPVSVPTSPQEQAQNRMSQLQARIKDIPPERLSQVSDDDLKSWGIEPPKPLPDTKTVMMTPEEAYRSGEASLSQARAKMLSNAKTLYRKSTGELTDQPGFDTTPIGVLDPNHMSQLLGHQYNAQQMAGLRGQTLEFEKNKFKTETNLKTQEIQNQLGKQEADRRINLGKPAMEQALKEDNPDRANAFMNMYRTILANGDIPQADAERYKLMGIPIPFAKPQFKMNPSQPSTPIPGNKPQTPVQRPPSEDQYKIGELRTTPDGKKARYMGNNKWLVE